MCYFVFALSQLPMVINKKNRSRTCALLHIHKQNENHVTILIWFMQLKWLKIIAHITAAVNFLSDCLLTMSEVRISINKRESIFISGYISIETLWFTDGILSQTNCILGYDCDFIWLIEKSILK